MSAARSSAFGGSEALWPLAAGVAASWRARLAWLGAFQGKRGVSSCRKAEGALVGEPRRLQLRDAASTQRGGCREGTGDRKRKTESNGGRKVGGSIIGENGRRQTRSREKGGGSGTPAGSRARPGGLAWGRQEPGFGGKCGAQMGPGRCLLVPFIYLLPGGAVRGLYLSLIET